MPILYNTFNLCTKLYKYLWHGVHFSLPSLKISISSVYFNVVFMLKKMYFENSDTLECQIQGMIVELKFCQCNLSWVRLVDKSVNRPHALRWCSRESLLSRELMAPRFRHEESKSGSHQFAREQWSRESTISARGAYLTTCRQV